jgi:integrase/recombinase XerD
LRNHGLTGSDLSVSAGAYPQEWCVHRLPRLLVGDVQNAKTVASHSTLLRWPGSCSPEREATRRGFVVDKETVRVRREHLEARRGIATESTALFLNNSGARLSTQGIANVISRLRRGAGIERHITPHMLRHTVATLLLRNGADIRVVQEFLGHTSIVTTQRYTHISKEHFIGVLRKHHPSMGMRPGTEHG